MRGWIVSLILAAGLAIGLQAQDEQALKDRFEGRKVTVRIDCPATNAGVDVDVFPSGGSQIDYSSYAKRLKSYGVALADGDSVLVTKVKAKKDMIEFQLGGGGYGTVGDDTDTSVHFTPAEKSQREKDLEKAFDSEQDPKKKRLIKEELDDLRWRRERDDDRNRRAAEAAAAAKADLIQQKRLQGGSRFNLYFGSKLTPQDLTAERIMKALERFVDFSEPGAGTASAGARRRWNGRPAGFRRGFLDPKRYVPRGSGIHPGQPGLHVRKDGGQPEPAHLRVPAGSGAGGGSFLRRHPHPVHHFIGVTPGMPEKNVFRLFFLKKVFDFRGRSV